MAPVVVCHGCQGAYGPAHLPALPGSAPPSCGCVDPVGRSPPQADSTILTHSFTLLQKDILMHRWRYPSLSLHGIEGAFSGSGAKTVIPRKVIGKFSIRLVPDMTPEVVSEQACGVPGHREGLLVTGRDFDQGS